ncbi:hypothetical protein C8R45DRAFT_1079230 [Mycena sanguinolenta]|nr:hypothetical protein C8R45DRAFT_1079230 [Mycena sanguinolenta]
MNKHSPLLHEANDFGNTVSNSSHFMAPLVGLFQIHRNGRSLETNGTVFKGIFAQRCSKRAVAGLTIVDAISVGEDVDPDGGDATVETGVAGRASLWRNNENNHRDAAVRGRMMPKQKRNVPQGAIQGQQLGEVSKGNVERSWGGLTYSCIIVPKVRAEQLRNEIKGNRTGSVGDKGGESKGRLLRRAWDGENGSCGKGKGKEGATVLSGEGVAWTSSKRAWIRAAAAAWIGTAAAWMTAGAALNAVRAVRGVNGHGGDVDERGADGRSAGRGRRAVSTWTSARGGGMGAEAGDERRREEGGRQGRTREPKV